MVEGVYPGYSQLKYFEKFGKGWEHIGHAACGITSLAMAIDKLTGQKVEPIEVMNELIKRHIVPSNQHNIWLKLDLNGKSIAIPIGMEGDGKKEHIPQDLITNNPPEGGTANGVYHPTWSVGRGLDHRHLDEVVGIWGLESKLIDTLPNFEIEIPKMLNNGGMILGSVSNSKTPWMAHPGHLRWENGSASHIVLLQGIEDFQGENTLSIYDPYSFNTSAREIKRSVKEFVSNEFNHRGTLLTKAR